MKIPDKALDAAVQALFDDGCGEPKVDASTALEAAYKLIAAQAWEEGKVAGASVNEGWEDTLVNPYQDNS